MRAALKNTALKSYAIAGLLLMVAGQVSAQPDAPVMVDIAPCMVLTGSVERYVCYDRLAAAARDTDVTAQQTVPAQPASAPQTTPVPVVETSSAAAPTAAAVADFGKSVPEPKTAEVVANENGDEELHDVITDLRQREPHRWLITLESGQTWYQSNSERFRLVKGMAVRIYPSPLHGSWRLARDDGRETGFIQVQRVD